MPRAKHTMQAVIGRISLYTTYNKKLLSALETRSTLAWLCTQQRARYIFTRKLLKLLHWSQFGNRWSKQNYGLVAYVYDSLQTVEIFQGATHGFSRKRFLWFAANLHFFTLSFTRLKILSHRLYRLECLSDFIPFRCLATSCFGSSYFITVLSVIDTKVYYQSGT